MKVLKRERIFEKKIKQRKLNSGQIFFAAKSGFYEGKLKDYSRYGLFIETGTPLSVGEVITIALPYMNSKNIICRGQITWSDEKGMGIELLRGSSPTNLKVFK
jgi:Tfp pilus assembly protein PilZ